MADMREFYLPGDATPEQIKTTMEEWGVVVLVRHFPAEQAEAWKRACIDWLIGLSKGKLKETAVGWKEEYLPAGPRAGMYQSLFSNAPPVWQMREALYPLFKDLYDERELLTSLDGGSIFPVTNVSTTGRDWAHLDQTVTDLLCIQGQVVLSDSLATFRCTPTSHKLHGRFLDICGRRGDKSNWLLFNAAQLQEVRLLLREDLWQLPIHAPAGSVILWRSDTIHSSVVSPVHPAMKDLTKQWAEASGQPSNRTRGFGFRGWRAVCYVSMQPKERFAAHEVYRLKDAALTGRMTNHWGTKIFPLKYKGAKCEEIAALLRDPSQVAQAKEDLSPLCRKLIGCDEW